MKNIYYLIMLTIAAIAAMALKNQLLADTIVEKFNDGTWGLTDLFILQFPILLWVPAVIWWEIVLLRKYKPTIAMAIVFIAFTIVSFATSI